MVPLLDKNDGERKARLETIRLEFECKLEALTGRIDDIISELDSELTLRSTISDETQTESVKRLTTLAAIFLPLSLASGLLSMGTRTSELGLLWDACLGSIS
ncbi:hypothetical protein DL768_000494 [Monosporascus sp. mg162]|nr:hypothetical protein DL768_000494 [Monosporascus sp. mg162]